MRYCNAPIGKACGFCINNIAFSAFVMRIAAHHSAVPSPIRKPRAYQQIDYAVSHNADNRKHQHRWRHRHTHIAA